MNDLLEYKKFYGSVNYSAEDDVFYGKIEDINDLISYEGESVDEIKHAFYDAVDDYIETCRQIGKEPEKSYRGVFSVRVPPDLHKRAFIMAKQRGYTLNKFVKEAIERELKTQE